VRDLICAIVIGYCAEMGKINENDKRVSDGRKKIGTEEMFDEFPPLRAMYAIRCTL